MVSSLEDLDGYLGGSEAMEWTGTQTMVGGFEEIAQLLGSEHCRCLRDGDGARTGRAEQTALGGGLLL